MITPAKAIAAGQRVQATVTYAGVPGATQYLGDNNWRADEHEVVTMDEPHMAPWWFPANDHPTDKALMDISITVPRGNTVISNGEQVSATRRRPLDDVSLAGRRADGDLPRLLRRRRVRGRRRGRPTASPGSTRSPSRARRRSARDRGRCSRRPPASCRGSASRLGRLPVRASPAAWSPSLDVGFSLETQTRPVYGFYVPEGSTRCWCTSWPTSGSATPSRSSGGATSGSTRASRASCPGCTTRTTAAGPPRSTSRRGTTPTRRRRTSGSAACWTPAPTSSTCSAKPSTSAVR